MATKPAEVALEQLKYQTWILKVSIHCEGCKKKVKKVLQGIDGVYMTEIDSQQHKVTVIGNVDAETLIKKLARSGKLAELWPQNPQKKDNEASSSFGKSNNNGKQNKQLEVSADHGDHHQDNNNLAENPDIVTENDSRDQPLETEIKEVGGETVASATGVVGGKKKKKNKKKKGENGNSINDNNNKVGDQSGETTIDAISPPVEVIPEPEQVVHTAPPPVINDNQYPPHHAYPYPPMYYAPPPPQAYGISYNTTYPGASEVSYYAPSTNSHMYYSSQPEKYHPPPSELTNRIANHQDDYDYDDNGGCSIM